MRLVFVENRYKTRLYEALAPLLLQEGRQIFWLVQNPLFTPGNGIVKTIPFPGKNDHQSRQPLIKLDKIIESDRQINFFGKKSTTYFSYYALEIERILKEVKPQYVFGEATAFHELITIELCKELDILYLNPSTCRYPTGRFSFYKYDTLDPYLGSGEILPEEQVKAIIQGIVKKEAKPDYMSKVLISRQKDFKDKFLKIRSYFQGERFNTPFPLVKYRLEKNKKQNIEQWETDAYSTMPKDGHLKVLYPLQMQPEANIDVWGRKWRNQTELILRIANKLQEDAVLYVKPNPKSKYELSEELVGLCKSHPKVRHISHRLNMESVFPIVDIVITVTGTIAIECILSNKPVVTLINTLNNEQANCVYIKDLDELEYQLEIVRAGNFPKISEREKVAYINELNATSYEGEISDPYSSIKSIQKTNINKIFNAFMAILNMNTSVQK